MVNATPLTQAPVARPQPRQDPAGDGDPAPKHDLPEHVAHLLRDGLSPRVLASEHGQVSLRRAVRSVARAGHDAGWTYPDFVGAAIAARNALGDQLMRRWPSGLDVSAVEFARELEYAWPGFDRPSPSHNGTK